MIDPVPCAGLLGSWAQGQKEATCGSLRISYLVRLETAMQSPMLHLLGMLGNMGVLFLLSIGCYLAFLSSRLAVP